MATGNGRGHKRACPNHCGRMIAEHQLRHHLEACSGGLMTVDTKEEYVVRHLADGKTQKETALELGMGIFAVRQKLMRLRHKWDARTTEQLLVKLAKAGEV